MWILADAVAFTFAGPLLIVALSAILLGETVGPRRWIAVIVGFIGVLVIIRPGAGTFQLAALLPVAVAFFYAIYQIITRHLSHRSDPLSMLFYTAIVGAVTMTIIVPFDWQTPTFEQWLMLVAIGFLVFGDFPDSFTFLGTAIIVASGVYVLHRERKVRASN